MHDSHIKLISSFWYAEIAKQLEFASFSILYRHVSMCLDWPPLKTIYYFSPHDFFKIMKYSVVFSTANLKLAISHILMFGSSHDAKANLFSFFKVQLFWEGHNNLPCGFDIYLVNVKTVRQIAQIFVAFSEKLNFKSRNLGFGVGDWNRSFLSKHKLWKQGLRKLSWMIDVSTIWQVLLNLFNLQPTAFESWKMQIERCEI